MRPRPTLGRIGLDRDESPAIGLEWAHRSRDAATSSDQTAHTSVVVAAQ
jgi:hypothetical protein